MAEIIITKCGIENCNSHYEYQLDEKHPVILVGQWKEETPEGTAWGGLLREKPRVGEIHELSMNGALKIDLSQSFWVAYTDAYSTYEGIDSEEGIRSLVFCLCRKINLKEVGEHAFLVDVEVLRVLEKEDFPAFSSPDDEILELLDKEADSRYYQVQNFEEYSYIRLNYQSDCGWNVIVAKQAGNYKIIAENYWDFHQDTWEMRDEELSAERVMKYGITK